MKRLLVSLVALTLCGSPLAAGKRDLTPKETMALGKREVAQRLKDPASAQFRNLKVGGEGAVLCGEINAKNGFGGYVGFRRFHVIPTQDFVRIEGDEAFLEETHQTFCR